jgi:UDP-GlcNAc3NAcA epimerase
MKIVSVVGARPQFVKAAVVSRALQAFPEIKRITIHTGQHYQDNMSAIFFEEMEIPEPSFNLGIGSGTHGSQTGRMLESIEKVLSEERPDWVIVYGDTNSTLAGALGAAKLHIPVAHVEAGLRSRNRQMPEEINRVLTDHISELLFAPTKLAVENLQHEGIREGSIRLVGDVMYDAAMFYAVRAGIRSKVLHRLNLEPKGYLLATVHRAENTDSPERLKSIFSALSQVGIGIPIICPIHPRTREALLKEQGIADAARGIRFIDPVGYLDMIMLERNARLIATDSGGVQKEAFFFSVPCVTLRSETEWQESIDLGWNRLASPAGSEPIATIILTALSELPVEKHNPYGNGRAAERIVQDLIGGDPTFKETSQAEPPNSVPVRTL